MPPPRILGQSATTPGMLDVETADGMRRSIPAWMAPRLGLSADLVAGDAAAREMQPAPAPQMADLTGSARGRADSAFAMDTPQPAEVATDAPAAPTAVDRAAAGALRGAQDVMAGATGMGGAAGAVATQLDTLGGAVDASVARVQAAQEAAGPEWSAAIARQTASADAQRTELATLEREAIGGSEQAAYELYRRSQTGDTDAAQAMDRARAFQGMGGSSSDPGQIDSLERAALQGDQAAVYQLFRLSQSGDTAAQQAMDRARAFRPQRSGGGGTRLTRTETTQLRQQARPTTEAEAAELQLAAAEQDRAEREGMLALAREAEAEAGALADTASAMQSAQSQLDALERRRQQAEQARQAELMRRQRALDTAASEVASRTLDPGRMYAKGETRNRTAAAIGLVLGGLADAITGGEAGLTTALGIINTAIDRDIEAQRGNVTIAQQGLAAKQSLLDDMRRTFGDQQAAEEATRATMLEGVERQIQALRLNAASDAQRAALDRMLADIQAQKAAARQAAVMGGIPMTDIVIEQRQRAGGGGARQADIPATPTGRRIEIPDAPDSGVQLAERRALADQEAAVDETIRSLDRMSALLDEGSLVGPVASRVPFRELISSNAREFDQLSTMLTMSMREDVLGPGTVTEAEKADLFNAVGLTSNLPASDVRRAVRNMRDRLLRKQAAARRGVSETAVAEAERRQPGETEAVTRQRGDLAQELGGTRR